MSKKNNQAKNAKPVKANKQTINVPLLQDGTFLLDYKKTSLAEWVGVGFVCLMFTVFVCFITKKLYFDMNHIKWLFNVVVMCLFVGALLLIGLTDLLGKKTKGFSISKEGFLKTFTIPQMFVAGYILFSLIAAFVSEYHKVWVGLERYEGFVSILIYGLIFILVSQFGKWKKYYIYCLAVSSILFSLIAIVQYFGKDPFGLYWGQYTFFDSQFVSTMGNIDIASGFVSLVLPMFLASYVLFEGKYRYYLIIPGYSLLLFVQLFTDVDSGKLGLIAAIAVALVILFSDSKKIRRIMEMVSISALVMIWHFAMKVKYVNEAVKVTWSFGGKKILLCFALIIISLIVWAYYFIKDTDFSAKAQNGFTAFLQKMHLSLQKIRITPKTYRIATVSIVGVAFVAAFIFLYTYSGTNATLVSMSHVTHGQLDDMAGWGRGFAWKKSVEMIMEKPIFGIGPDSFQLGFLKYYDEWVKISGRSTIFDYAHNDYLQMGVNTGLISLACYLGFMISLCVRSIKRIKKNPLIVIFVVGIVGYSIHVFFSFSIPILAPLFWLSCGLLDKLCRQTNMEGPDLLDPAPATIEQ